MIEVSEPLPAAISPSSQLPTAASPASAARPSAITSSIGMQAGVVVVAQPARLVVDHLLELRQPLGHRQDLVDLLLVLDRGEAHLGVRQHVGQLVGHRVGIDRHRDGAEHLRRHHRPVELRPVGADDRDGVAALEAEAVQPDRIGAHLVEHLRPGPGLPDAEILVPIRRAVAEQAGVADQQLGKRVRLRGGVARHGIPPRFTASRLAAARTPRYRLPAGRCRPIRKWACTPRSSQHLVYCGRAFSHLFLISRCQTALSQL